MAARAASMVAIGTPRPVRGPATTKSRSGEKTVAPSIETRLTAVAPATPALGTTGGAGPRPGPTRGVTGGARKGIGDPWGGIIRPKLGCAAAWLTIPNKMQ